MNAGAKEEWHLRYNTGAGCWAACLAVAFPAPWLVSACQGTRFFAAPPCGATQRGSRYGVAGGVTPARARRRQWASQRMSCHARMPSATWQSRSQGVRLGSVIAMGLGSRL